MNPTANSIVRFRALSSKDVDVFYARAFGDVEVTRHLQWKTHASADETRVLIEEMVALHQAGEKYFWVTLCAHDNRVLGLASIKPDANMAWIGFLVFSGEQRKGFGSAIVAALEEAVLGCFESISAAVAPENRPSIDLLRRCGWVEWPNSDVIPLLAFQKRRANHSGAANGRQPIRSETSGTPSAAGARR